MNNIRELCKKVLVIDDDESILDIITLRLSQQGIKCKSIKTKHEVEEILQKEQFDLIFLDIILGENETSEDIAKLLRKEEYAHIPVIIMSAHLNQKLSDSIKKKWPSVKNTLKKPFVRGDIISSIKKVFTHTEELELLTKKHQEIINKDNSDNILNNLKSRDNNGMNALMKISLKGESQTLQKILSFKIDPTLKSKDGKQAIHYACISGDVETVNLLIKQKCSLKVKDNKGLQPLFYAIKYSHIDLINFIMSINENLIQIRIDKNQSYLHYLLSKKNLEIFKLLLEYNIDKEVKDYNGNTVKTIALSKSLTEFIDALD